MGAPGKKTAETESQDDIEAIMNEIEELQQEMGVLEDEPAPAPAAPAKSTARLKVVNKAPAAPIEEEMMEETMAASEGKGSSLLDQAFDPEYGEIKEEVVDHVDPTETEHADHLDHDELESEMEPVSAGSGGSLAMTVQGQMALTLNHADSGQRVTVQFARDSFKVTCGDGTEVRIPYARKGLKR